MTWQQGWPERLHERVTELGFESLQEFARANEGTPMARVVEVLSGGFAPIQVAMAMGNDAYQNGWFRWFAQDQLVRSVRSHCPSGWAAPETSDFDRVHALAAWSAFMQGFRGVDANAVDSVVRAVRENAPEGWDPRDAEDPIIQAFVDTADWIS